MPKTTRGYVPVAIAGAVLLLMGARTMYFEVAPNVRGGSTAIARIANMPDGGAPIGLTILSQHRALLDCEKVLRSSQSLEIKYLEEREQSRLPIRCAEMAHGVLAMSPTDSFAWFISAAASAALSDDQTLNADLARSQLVGPNEGWLASMRLELGEDNLARLDSIGLASHQQDMRTVATAPAYRFSAALRFVADDDFRQRMTAQLDALTPAQQRGFLAAVRTSLRAKGR